MTAAARPRRRGPSAVKRRAILDAARESFLRHGYAGTAIEEVAVAAGVAKQTVYAHFSDKSRLFEHLIGEDIARSPSAQHPLVATMADTDDHRRDLQAYARAFVADVMQPHLLRMRRMLMAEAERFPELALAWYDAGPAASCATFAEWFAAWDARGLLRAPDPRIAAEHFNWLVLSIPLNRAMALPLDHPPFTAAELDRYADAGVGVFLAAYGAAQPPHGTSVDG